MPDAIVLDAANATEDALTLPTITDPIVMAAHDAKIVSARFTGKILFEEMKGLIDGRVSSRAYRNTWSGSVAAGDPVRISGNDALTLALATTLANSRVFGFVRYVSGGTVYIEHFRRITGLSGGTAGGAVYLTNAGSYSASAGTIPRIVGIWEDTTTALCFATAFTALFESAIFDDTEGDPANVAAAASDGTSNKAARRDHVHTIGSAVVTSDHLSADALLAAQVFGRF